MAHRLGGFAVRVLGPAAIHRRGRRAADTALDARLRTLLALLTAHANRPVPTRDLLTAWATPPSYPDDALASEFTRLRSVLAPEANVVSTDGGYLLRIDPRHVDAQRFLGLVAQARTARPDVAAPLLLRALALWRGPAYPELRRDGVEHAEAVRLAEVGWRAIEDLGAHELALGQPALAAERLTQALDANPLRERTCMLAMHALHGAGRTPEALRCYEKLRERLRSELGTAPAEETRTLYLRLGGRSHASPGPSLPGREAELDRLPDLLERERSVTVTGPGGAGKSRLVREALATVELPVTTVRLATTPPGGTSPAVAAALGLHATEPPREDPRAAANELLAAIVDVLAMERRVLVLDDCDAVLEPVRALVATVRARCPGVTVVATCREPLGVGAEHVLALDALPSEESSRLLLARARELDPAFSITPLENTVVQTILRSVGRLPLTVEVAGARAGAYGVATLAELPKNVVEWCAEQLDPEHAGALTALGVFPDGFGAWAAETVADTDAVAGLVASGLLTVDGETSGNRYRLPSLVHEIAARALAGSPDEHKVRERHARWCLDNVEDATTADLVESLRWAESEQPALAARLAGTVGMTLSPWCSTVDFLGTQLRIANSCRDALALGAGARAAVLFGAHEHALSLAAQAKSIAELDEEHALAWHAEALAHRERGDAAAATAACHALLRLDEAPAAFLADARTVLALLATARGEPVEALHLASAARSLALAAGAAEHVAFAEYADGDARIAVDLPTGADVLAGARERAVAANAPLVRAASATTLAEAHLRLGRLPEAAKLLVEAFALWRRTRSRTRLVETARIATTLLAARGGDVGGFSGVAALSPSAAERAVAEEFGLRSIPTTTAR